ncbi:hypothetical protein [Ottowia sp.]|uniref:hypothetical protein n=1 Tax=Ottowia sp. TaxID=1898956 RepID=UPI003A895D4E
MLKVLRWSRLGLLGTVVFMFWAVQAQTAPVCPIVTVEQVARALPGYSNWVLADAGPGGCTFDGKTRASGKTQGARISFIQEYFDQPAQAAEQLASLRTPLAKAGYKLTPLALKGALPSSFSCRMDSGEGARARSTLFWEVQVDAAILSAMLMAPDRVKGLDHTALSSMLQSAVAATALPEARAQASRCEGIDEALVARMLGGQRLKVRQMGGSHCMASNERDDVLTVHATRTFVDGLNLGDGLLERAGADCKGQQASALDGDARLSHACTDGDKRAELAIKTRDHLITYTLILSGRKEPAEAQRTMLLELGQQRLAK